MEREFNTDMLNKAEAIRCIRTQSLINEEFGFLDKTRQKADFLAYFEKMTHKKDDKWTCVYKHFFKFVQGHCTFGDVTVELCKKFREYLLNANQLNRTKQKVSLNSAAGYYSTFRGLLKIAYRDKWLRENFTECYIGIPSKEEQTKIAKLLRLIDERIATQSKLIEKLESLIKGIMVELQKQGVNKGTWKQVFLSDVLTERNERNTSMFFND